jgi:hypothetical protein
LKSNRADTKRRIIFAQAKGSESELSESSSKSTAWMHDATQDVGFKKVMSDE